MGECPDVVALEQEREVQRFYITLSRFIFCLAEAEKGIVLMLDDLHWSDMGTIRLLEEMLRDITDKHILVIGSFRESELTADHPLRKIVFQNESQSIEEIRLAELNAENIRTFMDSNIKMKEEDSVLLSELIFRKAGGNPLFMQVIIKQFFSDGVLVKKEERWEPDIKCLSAIEIPESLIDAMLKRMRMLSREELSILKSASVIGKTFDIDMLMKIESKPDRKRDLDDEQNRRIIGIIDRALDMQILVNEAAPGRYSFSHDRVRDAFYEQVPVKEKKSLHSRIGQIIEEDGKFNKDSIIFDLAYHFIEAGYEDKILEYAYPAGLKSARNFSHEDAIKYFEIAREILQKYLDKGNEKYHRQWIECTKNLGETLHVAGLPDESLKLFHELLPYMKSNKEKALIYLQITHAYVKKFNIISAELYARDGLALLGEKLPASGITVRINIIKELMIHTLQRLFPFFSNSKKPEDLEKYLSIIRYYDCLFWVYYFTDLHKLARIILCMLNISERKIGPSRELAISLMYYAVMLITKKFSISSTRVKKRGYDYLQRAYDMLSKLGDEWGIGYWQWGKNNFNMICSEYAIVVKNQINSIKIVESIGDVQEIIKSYHILFMAHYYLSNYAEAYNFYIKSKKYINNELIKAYTFGIGYPSGYYIETGQYDKAEEELMRLYIFCSKNNIWDYYCSTCIFLGYLYTEKGELDKAFNYLNEAQTLMKNEYDMSLIVGINILFLSRYTHLLIKDYLNKQKILSEYEIIIYRKKIKYTVSQADRKIYRMLCWHCTVPREMGNYYALINNKKKAHFYYNKAIDLCKRIGRRYELARSLYEYGEFLKQTGEKHAAWEKLTGAYLLFEEIGITLYREKIAALLGLSADMGKAGESVVFRERMQYMIDKSREFADLQSLPDFLGDVLSLAMELSGSRNGYLFLADDEDGKLKPACEKHVDAKEADDYSWNIVNKVYESGKPVIAADAGIDETFSLYQSVAGQKLKSVLCVPASHNEIVSGVCYLDNPLTGSIFADEEERLISMMLANAAIVIENIILHDRLKEKEIKFRERLTAPDKKYLEKAFEYIGLHYAEEMQRERIADSLAVNPDYLGRIFKSKTGKTIQEYVNEVRVKHAAERLAEASGGKIIEIAMDAGFDSIRTFNRVFYRVMGITPSEYREKAGRN